MIIRKLEKKDAPLMLEWMHDEDVVMFLKTDFKNMTMEDCIRFIECAEDSSDSVHLAIADEQDEYKGTVSLKHIKGKNAEFGITIRRCAMGKGYSWFAMSEIFRIAKEKFALKSIYWCVDPRNIRAEKFYEKHGFSQIMVPENTHGYSDEERKEFIWYGDDI